MLSHPLSQSPTVTHSIILPCFICTSSPPSIKWSAGDKPLAVLIQWPLYSHCCLSVCRQTLTKFSESANSIQAGQKLHITKVTLLFYILCIPGSLCVQFFNQWMQIGQYIKQNIVYGDVLAWLLFDNCFFFSSRTLGGFSMYTVRPKLPPWQWIKTEKKWMKANSHLLISNPLL